MAGKNGQIKENSTLEEYEQENLDKKLQMFYAEVSLL